MPIRSIFICIGIATTGLLVGCGKGKAAPEASAVIEAAQAPQTPEQVQQIAAGASEANANLTAANQAMQAKKYDDAAADLMKNQLNAAALSAKDAIATANAMRNLQIQLAEAAAKGDPKAQAAIQLLRSVGPR